MSTEEKIEEFVVSFVDETTGKTRKKRVRVTSKWHDDVPRYHGDGEGWSGWVEYGREEELLEDEG